MTAVRLTPAQARALGIDETAQPGRMTARAAVRRGGGQRPEPYHTQCDTCGEQFTTRAGEDRHLAATRHPRYQLILELETTRDE